jgi:hypothetical protein
MMTLCSRENIPLEYQQDKSYLEIGVQSFTGIENTFFVWCDFWRESQLKNIREIFLSTTCCMSASSSDEMSGPEASNRQQSDKNSRDDERTQRQRSDGNGDRSENNLREGESTQVGTDSVGN